MATVIERTGTHVDAGGYIHHDEKLSSYEAAEAIAGRNLDRRKNYAIIEGQVAESATWSQACSGCYEGYDQANGRGHGCSECGYTGRVRRGAWVPLTDNT